MATSTDWTHPADERILQHLHENPPDYVPLIANRLGMHLGYVERRVETLVEEGLVEPITGEEIYAVTEKGKEHLAHRTSVVASGDD